MSTRLGVKSIAVIGAGAMGRGIAYAALAGGFRTLGERFQPSRILVEHVQAGRLGRKSGRGVYEYKKS